jgi:uncharacterized damage-inducible protein DinB
MLTALLDHLAWADARALEALRAMPPGTPEADRAATIYAHLAAAAHVWLSRLEGRAPAYAVWPTLGLDEAEALARETAAALRAHAAGLDAAGLAREVSYRTSAGQPFVNTVGDVIAHVALHGSYHRGQLALLARQGGAAPAATDYIVWARGAPAPALAR